jgi:hypothetical protein
MALRPAGWICCGRRFRLITARQYSRAVAQDHQPLGIIFNGGFVERARNGEIMVLHEDPLDAGALAALAEQFDPVLALHASILATAGFGVYPPRHGHCRHGRCRHGRCRHGRCRHGRCRHGRCRHGRCRYGRCRHGRCRHCRCRHGRRLAPPCPLAPDERNRAI